MRRYASRNDVAAERIPLSLLAEWTYPNVRYSSTGILLAHSGFRAGGALDGPLPHYSNLTIKLIWIETAKMRLLRRLCSSVWTNRLMSCPKCRRGP
jgi:hypothetical protein